jgi:hypothetical protein
MPRYFLREDTKDLTNLRTDQPKQMIQVQKYQERKGKTRYLLTVLQWWDNPDVPDKSGYECTHRLDCEKFSFEDNTSKD